MIDHYNAFISYRHAPADIRVAETVQRSLEHFHIPRKIQKQTGKKRIQRIFRDKDELPITSNLTDTISHALEVSDYLIVICSTSTKESIWVQREIEFFLRNHTKNQILTVLVDGEDPYEVIPEILQYDEHYVTDSTGRMQLVRHDIEPLSCDFRMPFSKAKKVELPRLASAIIGCSYDELMNRRRQYTMRKMGIISAAVTLGAAAFSGYMVYANAQVKKNYLESLKNQSKYLANESLNRLEEEDRITALQLALESLPKDETDVRPVTPEATRALTEATLAYIPDTSDNIFAAWNYRMPQDIRAFELSPDGKTLAAYDSAGSVALWNTTSHEQILDLTPGSDGVDGIKYCSNNYLLVWNVHKLTAYSPRDGSVQWEIKKDSFRFTGDDAEISKSQSFYIETEQAGDFFLTEISEVNGDIIKDHPINVVESWGGSSVYEYQLSPDNTHVAMRVSPDYNTYCLGIMDLKDDKIKVTEESNEFIKTIYWVDDTKLMLASSVIGSESNSSYGNLTFLSTDNVDIRCINPADLTDYWKSEFSSNDVMINNEFMYLPKTNSVAYYSGNIACMYDINTGECLYKHNVNDSIVNMSDNDGNGYPLYISEGGGYFYPNPDMGTDALIGNHYFTDDLKKVTIGNGAYVLKQLGKEILYYGVHEYDHQWTEFSHGLEFEGLLSYYKGDDVVALWSTSDAENVMTILNLEDFETVSKFKFEGDASWFDRFILGSDKENIYVMEKREDGNYLVTIKIKNGKGETVKFTDINSNLENSSGFRDGKIYYTHAGESWESVLTIYDVKMKVSVDFTVSDKSIYSFVAPVYFPESKRVYIQNKEADKLVNTESGEVMDVTLPDFWNGTSMIGTDEDTGRILVSDKKIILLVNADGKVCFPIKCPGLMPRGFGFVKDPTTGSTVILVVYSDGSLYRYSSEDGSFIGKSDLSSVSVSEDYTFEKDYENNLLYLQTESSLNIYDMTSWIELAQLDYCIGHHAGTDRFISVALPSRTTKQVGYFEHYTTEELIEKAKEILQGQELTEEQKSVYGIGNTDEN